MPTVVSRVSRLSRRFFTKAGAVFLWVPCSEEQIAEVEATFWSHYKSNLGLGTSCALPRPSPLLALLSGARLGPSFASV